MIFHFFKIYSDFNSIPCFFISASKCLLYFSTKLSTLSNCSSVTCSNTTLSRSCANHKRKKELTAKQALQLSFSYSFTAPSMIPDTKYFCKKGYTINIGTMAIKTLAALSVLLDNSDSFLYCSGVRFVPTGMLTTNCWI